MEIQLTAPLARGAGAEAYDVRQLKRALNRLGFYNPDHETGIDGEEEPQFRDALRAFQHSQTIPADAPVGPGSLTETRLNAEMEAQDQNALYTWRTVGDDKVRSDHAHREGMRFRWSAPPEGGNPGEDYNCRCWAEPLAPPRHPWIDWVATREEERVRDASDITSGAMGMPVPAEPLPPEWQEVSAATVLWDAARITVAACWGNKACRAWMIREGAKIVLENTYHLPPKNLPAFPDAENVKRKGGRERWIDSKGRIYEWDYKKGEVEIYDKTGKKHQGGFDPKTGKQRSKPVSGRRAEK